MIRVFVPDPEPDGPPACSEHGTKRWYARCGVCYAYHMYQNLSLTAPHAQAAGA